MRVWHHNCVIIFEEFLTKAAKKNLNTKHILKITKKDSINNS